MWQINNKNAITFLFSIEIFNGLHNREELIFLDLMEFLKNYPLKFKIDLKFWKKWSKSLDLRNFFKIFFMKN